MKWRPDVPDLPIDKPKRIEDLEKMDRIVLDSMPPREVDELVDEIAHDVAVAYKKQAKDPNHDECEEVISVALRVTGSALQGQVGLAMIAACDSAAKTASDLAFPPPPEF